jgi:hypothetical protein
VRVPSMASRPHPAPHLFFLLLFLRKAYNAIKFKVPSKRDYESRENGGDNGRIRPRVLTHPRASALIILGAIMGLDKSLVKIIQPPVSQPQKFQKEKAKISPERKEGRLHDLSTRIFVYLAQRSISGENAMTIEEASLKSREAAKIFLGE